MVSIATVVCYIPKAILPDYDNLEENAAVSLKQWWQCRGLKTAGRKVDLIKFWLQGIDWL